MRITHFGIDYRRSRYPQVHQSNEGKAVPNYPYASGQTAVVQTFTQLRKGFPGKVDAGYLQRFNIAPSNESYVISILRFLGLIDEDGSRVEDKTDYFYSNDGSFRSGLEGTIRSAYSQLFDEMGNGAIDAAKGDLIHWFRASDKTSDLVGQRQASTFQTLAALAGHGDLPAARSGAEKKTEKKNVATTPGPPAKKTVVKAATSRRHVEKPATDAGGAEVRTDVGIGVGGKNGLDVGLTVRIEVNLPPGGDADTYDAIFASIKKHLMS
jgi:hypothetical protein